MSPCYCLSLPFSFCFSLPLPFAKYTSLQISFTSSTALCDPSYAALMGMTSKSPAASVQHLPETLEKRLHHLEIGYLWVEDKLDKAKVNIAGVQDEFTVAGVEGTLEDEVDADRKHDPYRAGYAPSSNGLTDEHGYLGKCIHSLIPSSHRRVLGADMMNQEGKETYLVEHISGSLLVCDRGNPVLQVPSPDHPLYSGFSAKRLGPEYED
ncbi:small secreted protein [Laccaria bicolor S238N-H82]|uniref:Small secreted protein n=1 Tax=Laccaria bicolor (strain S238N-H82 / ATCC MYA-4686) TaxID=486041 RepID=B0D5X8_LACBS|nr:small secreted protein [Laccaria bicolor S238N-H82]EDR10101.1 small secreted protein [Laccaria bicolor S238N-H82]|eukprot:XP_001879486.1 small secreted protein [Laccaria bicolor S238N-H82]